MRHTKFIALLAVLLVTAAARAGVILNEVFYHAPNDLEDLQWIELYNTGDQPVDLTDWSIEKGRIYKFPQGTNIAANGYLIVARNPTSFQLHYKQPALGPFKEML